MAAVQTFERVASELARQARLQDIDGVILGFDQMAVGRVRRHSLREFQAGGRLPLANLPPETM